MKEYSIWENVGYWLLLWSCKVVGWLPNWFLYYFLLEILYFILYGVLRYRVKVVRKNLLNSYPERTKRELRSIERGFYRHLAEIFIDTIDLASISKKQILRRMTFQGVEEHEAKMANRDWIAAMAHYGSWEYFGVYQMYTQSQVVPVYRPLHSRVFDKFYYNLRSRSGVKPVAMNDILRYTIKSQKDGEQNITIGLIADQNTPKERNHLWFDFLNQKTQFFPGIEKMAVGLKMPVYFVKIEKLRRARYDVRLIEIYDGLESVAEGEVTERYVRALEQLIVTEPRYWMWSHRRWKRKYPGDEAVKAAASRAEKSGVGVEEV